MFRILQKLDIRLGRPVELTLRLIVFVLISVYYLLLFATLRIEQQGGEIPQALKTQGLNFMVTSWHGRLFILGLVARRKIGGKLLAFNSPHLNGKMLAYLNAWIRIKTVYGAPNKEPRRGMRNALRIAKQGYRILLTPDGPRGPRQRAKGGIILMAKFNKNLIVPVGFSAKYGFQLKSWDRFLMPLPFTRIMAIWGEPIHVPADCNKHNLEKYRLLLESCMNQLMAKADLHYNRIPVEVEKTDIYP